MSLRRLSAVLIPALSFVLTACPKPVDKPDGNDVEFDGGNPPPRDACSGGCAENQVCDTARKTCVDGCGGCDGGTCVNMGDGTFMCRALAVACSGTQCEPGQVACLGGECACLSSLSGTLDTCRAVGKWCNGRLCQTSRAFEQCNPGQVAGCATGYSCIPLFAEDLAVCLKNCTVDVGCDVGEVCLSQRACLPTGIFTGPTSTPGNPQNQECEQNKADGDGGFVFEDGGAVRVTVTVGNTCLLKSTAGEPIEPVGLGTGNCTYSIFKFWNQGVYPFSTCRPPGLATEGQACRDEAGRGTLATQCSSGLRCATTKGGIDGVCLRACNAQPPALGFSPQPECHSDEACVNSLRYTDPNSNAVLGVCMSKCNVFDPVKSACSNVGSTPASCVPTEASGELVLTTNGDGICAPQRAAISSTGTPCAETDAFKGAACASGHMCTSLDPDAKATCTAVCDLECNPTDGGVAPSRCATEPNAKCASGKTCRRVSSTTGARVGFCL